MIILPNGDVLRNLEEQVLENKNKIEEHYKIDRVLADFGIMVIGRVDTRADIDTQPIPEGGYQYGDAYAVGPEDTIYDYYIYTRPFEGETEAHWFNIGALQIAGPQGPDGERGPAGEKGDNAHFWVVSTAAELEQLPSQHPGLVLPYDLAIIGNGDIYQCNESLVFSKTSVNIRGPQGIQGLKGDRGETGPQGTQGPKGNDGDRGLGLVILGNDLESVSSLPAPTSVRRDGAYLINVNSEKHLYAITGTGASGDPLKWEDLGVYTLTSSGSSSTLYRHRIYMNFGGWNNESFNAYFDYYDSSSEPYNANTIFNILPGNGRTESMGIIGIGSTNYGISIATSIGYYHETGEYYTQGYEYIYFEGGTPQTGTTYGFTVNTLRDQVSQV